MSQSSCRADTKTRRRPSGDQDGRAVLGLTVGEPDRLARAVGRHHPEVCRPIHEPSLVVEPVPHPRDPARCPRAVVLFVIPRVVLAAHERDGRAVRRPDGSTRRPRADPCSRRASPGPSAGSTNSWASFASRSETKARLRPSGDQRGDPAFFAAWVIRRGGGRSVRRPRTRRRCDSPCPPGRSRSRRRRRSSRRARGAGRSPTRCDGCRPVAGQP